MGHAARNLESWLREPGNEWQASTHIVLGYKNQGIEEDRSTECFVCLPFACAAVEFISPSPTFIFCFSVCVTSSRFLSRKTFFFLLGHFFLLPLPTVAHQAFCVWGFVFKP